MPSTDEARSAAVEQMHCTTAMSIGVSLAPPTCSIVSSSDPTMALLSPCGIATVVVQVSAKQNSSCSIQILHCTMSLQATAAVVFQLAPYHPTTATATHAPSARHCHGGHSKTQSSGKIADSETAQRHTWQWDGVTAQFSCLENRCFVRRRSGSTA